FLPTRWRSGVLRQIGGASTREPPGFWNLLYGTPDEDAGGQRRSSRRFLSPWSGRLLVAGRSIEARQRAHTSTRICSIRPRVCPLGCDEHRAHKADICLLRVAPFRRTSVRDR